MTIIHSLWGGGKLFSLIWEEVREKDFPYSIKHLEGGKKMKKKLTLLVALIMAVSTLSACGGNADVTSAAATTESSGGESTVATTGSGTEDSRDVVVTVQLKADVGTFDPFGQASEAARRLRFMVFQTLFRFNDYGSDPEPLLAKSYVQEDELVYIITLNENICDSAGNPFTANDVIYSIKTQNETGYQANTLDHVDLEACEAVDDTTVKVVLKDQAVEVWEALIGRIPMVTEAAYSSDADNMTNNPVGTGAYMLESWTGGSEVVLVKNDQYWRTGGNDQNVDKIVFKVISESAQRGIEMETGAVDILYDCAIDDLQRFLADPDNYNVYIEESPNMSLLFFNCSEDSVCTDVRVRQAIAYAVDANAVVAAVYRGYAAVANTLCSPLYSEWTDSMKDNDFYNVNIEKAKALLEEAGYGDGLELRFMVDESANSQAVAQIVQAAVSQIGVTITIESYETAVYSTNIYDPTVFDIYFGTLRADVSAMALFNNRLNAISGSNRVWYNNAEFQALVEECVTGTASKEKIDELYAMFNEEIPIYPLASLQEIYVTTKGIEDFHVAVGSYLFPGSFAYTSDFKK